MRFEYLTTFVSVFYQEEEGGGFFDTKISLPCDPMIESLTANLEYAEYMNRLGSAAWELVNVQPLLRGVRELVEPSFGLAIGYSLTAGYYLFWKRSVE